VNALVGVTYKVARRIVIAIVGFTVLLLGVIMLVTPGPAFLMIPGGLAILGLEFAWARHWLKKARQTISNQAAKTRGNRAEKHRRNHDSRMGP
jgi:tellurite resistance protein TerC